MALAAIEVVEDGLDDGNNEPSSLNAFEAEPLQEEHVQQGDDHLPQDLASLWNHFKVVSADKTKVECLIKQCGVLSFSPPGFSPTKLLLHLQTKHKQFYETTLKKKLLKRSNKKSIAAGFSSEKWIDRDIFSTNFTFDKSKLNLDRLKTIAVSFNGYRLHVPIFLVDAFDLLCLSAKTEGLFQIRGNRQRVKYMRYVFFGEFGIPEYCTLYDVCDLITYFLRHLSEPIFSTELEKQFLELRRSGSFGVLNKLKMCLKELEPSKRDTIIYLAVKLKYIVSLGNVNKATTHKIAQYFAKSLFRKKLNNTDGEELDLRVKSIVSLIDFIGFILSEKDSVLFKKPLVAPRAPPSATLPVAPYAQGPQKQAPTLITVSPTPPDEEIDVKPIIVVDKKTSKKKKVVTIDDDVDENEPCTLQPKSLESNISSAGALEYFPPYVSLTGTEVVDNDADRCNITADHQGANLVESTGLEAAEDDDKNPMKEIVLSNSELFACPYCSESFKSALLQSYHVRQKHSKQFLGKKSRIKRKNVDETRKITIKKIKAAKLPKKFVRPKNSKLKIKLRQKVVGDVVEKLKEADPDDKLRSETSENKETPMVDAAALVQEASISETLGDNLELNSSSLNLETDAGLTNMES